MKLLRTPRARRNRCKSLDAEDVIKVHDNQELQERFRIARRAIQVLRERWTSGKVYRWAIQSQAQCLLDLLSYCDPFVTIAYCSLSTGLWIGSRPAMS